MKGEAVLDVGLIAVLSGVVGYEGKRNTELQAAQALSPAQVWKKLASSQRIQIVDAREDAVEYEDFHIPGALPSPGCDETKTPVLARDRIYPYLPTVVVTAEGDEETFRKCAARFKVAWNLAGGMEAWSDQALPEDSGEYTPPRVAAGGGCL